MDIETVLKRYPVRATFKYGEAKKTCVTEPWLINNWRVTLKYHGRQLSTDFYGGGGITNPTVVHVMTSLIVDAHAGEMSFSEFCTEFGYDEDSRTTYAAWQACCKLLPKLSRLLGDDFDAFLEADW